MVIVGIAAFFSSRGMFLVCFAFLPLLSLLSQSAYPDNPNTCFQNINSIEPVQEILDGLTPAGASLSDYVSNFFRSSGRLSLRKRELMSSRSSSIPSSINPSHPCTADYPNEDRR
jgi:hypothetical protein